VTSSDHARSVPRGAALTRYATDLAGEKGREVSPPNIEIAVVPSTGMLRDDQRSVEAVRHVRALLDQIETCATTVKADAGALTLPDMSTITEDLTVVLASVVDMIDALHTKGLRIAAAHAPQRPRPDLASALRHLRMTRHTLDTAGYLTSHANADLLAAQREVPRPGAS
jgi:hypothetical protein